MMFIILSSKIKTKDSTKIIKSKIQTPTLPIKRESSSMIKNPIMPPSASKMVAWIHKIETKISKSPIQNSKNLKLKFLK